MTAGVFVTSGHMDRLVYVRSNFDLNGSYGVDDTCVRYRHAVPVGHYWWFIVFIVHFQAIRANNQNYVFKIYLLSYRNNEDIYKYIPLIKIK